MEGNWENGFLASEIKMGKPGYQEDGQTGVRFEMQVCEILVT